MAAPDTVVRERSKITDWIQVVLLCVAGAVAVYEIYISSDAPRLEKARNTVELLKDGYGDEVLASAAFMIKVANSSGSADLTFTDTLVELTPFHEYLLAFSVCYDTGLCLEDEALEYLCGRITFYENEMPAIYERYGKGFDLKTRKIRKTQAWADCVKKLEYSQ